jgi:uncharacterized protein (TIGR02284 family)
MSSDTDTSTLNELIDVLEDGRNFYADAATKVERADLRALFERMARVKASILGDLRNKVVFNGEEPSEGSFAGTVRKAYAELKASLVSDSQAEYVAQLEEFEDRILDEFRAAIQDTDDPEVRAIAGKYMPEVMRDHDEMKALKDAMGKGK